LSHANARRFAECLDREDYPAAEKLLAEACIYATGGGTIHGPAAIIAEYRANSEWGRRVLERVEYSSRLIESGNEFALVEFRDEIHHNGRRHTHTCRQRLWFGPDGLIVRIEQLSDPEASARLAAFFASVGVERR
jgi:hypothetical protein